MPGGQRDRRAFRGAKDPGDDRRHHGAQTHQRCARGRQAACGAGQSREVALPRRRQSRSATAAANPQPSARDIGEVDQGRRRTSADPQARRAARGHVGHVEHSARHQPAGSRDRQSGGRGLSDRCRVRAAQDRIHLSRGSKEPRLARGRERPLCAERSAAARADDPQSLMECREIHAARQDPSRLPPARRQAPARSLGHRHGHPCRAPPVDLRRIPSGRQSGPGARPGPWPRSRYRAADRNDARPRDRRPFPCGQGLGLCRRGAAGTRQAGSMGTKGQAA